MSERLCGGEEKGEGVSLDGLGKWFDSHDGERYALVEKYDQCDIE